MNKQGFAPIIIIIIIAAALVVGGGAFYFTRMDTSAPPALGAVGEDVTIRGEVTRVDGATMLQDGDGEVYVKTEGRGDVKVLISADEIPCVAPDLQSDFEKATPGVEVEVRGRVESSGTIRLCASAQHGLDVVSEDTPPPPTTTGSGVSGTTYPTQKECESATGKVCMQILCVRAGPGCGEWQPVN